MGGFYDFLEIISISCELSRIEEGRVPEQESDRAIKCEENKCTVRIKT